MADQVGSYKEGAPAGWKGVQKQRYGAGNSPTQGKKVGSSVTSNRAAHKKDMKKY